MATTCSNITCKARRVVRRSRIEFLPHNVYTSFPQQTEILYLLLMHLHRQRARRRDPLAIAARFDGRSCRLRYRGLAAGGLAASSASLVGTTPWIAYLGCLAYRKSPAFRGGGGGIVLTWYRDAIGDAQTPRAGFCEGLAGACKYTGLVLRRGPVCHVRTDAAAGVAIDINPAVSRAYRHPYLLGVTLGLGPWLARNTAFTGNPVYPFAYDWFGGRGWSDEQNAQWKAGHNLRGEENGFIGRFAGRRRVFRAADRAHAIGWSYFGLLPAAQFWGW